MIMKRNPGSIGFLTLLTTLSTFFQQKGQGILTVRPASSCSLAQMWLRATKFTASVCAFGSVLLLAMPAPAATLIARQESQLHAQPVSGPQLS